MGLTVLKNGLVYTSEGEFKALELSFESGTITGLSQEPLSGDEVIDCSGCYIVPGLTDIHLHGCRGHELSGSYDDLREICEFELENGVTTILPATMTLPDDRLKAVLSASADYAMNSPVSGAIVAGINLEGPFISPEKCGAQDKRFAAAPSAEKLLCYQDAAKGMIKLVTVAPELEGAVDMISRCSDSFHFSLGHTCSSYDIAAEAFAAGADHVTHLFNAMPPFHHRDTGVIGAAFDSEHCYAELICDGVHVSPSAVRSAFALFGERLVLISDSMEAAGMPDGEYTLGGQRVLKNGARATLPDGTLAGSVSTLYDCLKTAVGMGIPLESAVRAATLSPCRSVGIDDIYGSLEIGKAAHILVLSRDDLSIKRVIS